MNIIGAPASKQVSGGKEMTAYEMYQLIRRVLDRHDGCCLDNEEEVVRVASALQVALEFRLDLPSQQEDD